MTLYQQNEPMRTINLPNMPQLPGRLIKLALLVIAGFIALLLQLPKQQQ